MPRTAAFQEQVAAVPRRLPNSASVPQNEPTAMPNNKRRQAENRAALKRFRKLSEWTIKHKSYRACNMRNCLGKMLNERHAKKYDDLCLAAEHG